MKKTLQYDISIFRVMILAAAFLLSNYLHLPGCQSLAIFTSNSARDRKILFISFSFLYSDEKFVIFSIIR